MNPAGHLARPRLGLWCQSHVPRALQLNYATRCKALGTWDWRHRTRALSHLVRRRTQAATSRDRGERAEGSCRCGHALRASPPLLQKLNVSDNIPFFVTFWGPPKPATWNTAFHGNGTRPSRAEQGSPIQCAKSHTEPAQYTLGPPHGGNTECETHKTNSNSFVHSALANIPEASNADEASTFELNFFEHQCKILRNFEGQVEVPPIFLVPGNPKRPAEP